MTALTADDRKLINRLPMLTRLFEPVFIQGTAEFYKCENCCHIALHLEKFHRLLLRPCEFDPSMSGGGGGQLYGLNVAGAVACPSCAELDSLIETSADDRTLIQDSQWGYALCDERTTPLH